MGVHGSWRCKATRTNINQCVHGSPHITCCQFMRDGSQPQIRMQFIMYRVLSSQQSHRAIHRAVHRAIHGQFTGQSIGHCEHVNHDNSERLAAAGPPGHRTRRSCPAQGAEAEDAARGRSLWNDDDDDDDAGEPPYRMVCAVTPYGRLGLRSGPLALPFCHCRLTFISSAALPVRAQLCPLGQRRPGSLLLRALPPLPLSLLSPPPAAATDAADAEGPRQDARPGAPPRLWPKQPPPPPPPPPQPTSALSAACGASSASPAWRALQPRPLAQGA